MEERRGNLHVTLEIIKESRNDNATGLASVYRVVHVGEKQHVKPSSLGFAGRGILNGIEKMNVVVSGSMHY